MTTSQKKSKEKPVSKENIGQRLKAFNIKAFLEKDKISFIISLSLLCFSLFLLVSLISYTVNGTVDYTFIKDGNVTVTYSNWCGRLGAQMAYLFLNNYFGLGSFFIPIFLVALSLTLMHSYRFKIWRLFIHCGFLTIWTSLALTLISGEKYFHWFPTTWLEPFAIPMGLGGGHGKEVCEFLNQNIGILGLTMVVAVSLLLYLVWVYQDTTHIFRKMLHPRLSSKWKEKLHKHKKEEVEEVAVGEEPTADDMEEGEEWNEMEEVEEPSVYHLDATSEEREDATAEEVHQETAPAEDPEQTRVSFDLEDSANIQNTKKKTKGTAAKDGAAGGEGEENNNFKIHEAKEEETTNKRTLESPVERQGAYDPRKDLEHYEFPTLSLLKHYPNLGPDIDMDEQNANKDRIVEVLKSFDVGIVNIEATIGPTITLYEVEPAPGVRINKIRNLGDDIALSLSALGIRIIAPIPGRGTIGIEVPNRNPKLVSMESILNSKKFAESDFALPLAIGKTITNEVFMVDLAKMPHILVAGATGQGKSVGLNAMITSLLYKKHPSELKIVMVDPKKVEFSIYAPLEKYFLAKLPTEEDPIITDVSKVVQTLKSLCVVMDHRYDLLKKAGVRHITEYNAKFIQRRLNPNDGHEYMPYIVIVIDEFGDLIMTAGKEVELPIARIAQLARAVGMHLIIATQRPTTNIITGTIKANFPARMAFKVTSGIDSRTILERPGANQLIGRGDLLFLAGTEPVRVQCAFLDTAEVDNINKHISSQQGYMTAYELPEVDDEEEGGRKGGSDEPLDELFAEIARYIILSQQGSTSLIQRKFAIGYNRAGRVMDQLEAYGIVGAARGSKPREVLIQDPDVVEEIVNR